MTVHGGAHVPHGMVPQDWVASWQALILHGVFRRASSDAATWGAACSRPASCGEAENSVGQHV